MPNRIKKLKTANNSKPNLELEHKREYYQTKPRTWRNRPTPNLALENNSEWNQIKPNSELEDWE